MTSNAAAVPVSETDTTGTTGTRHVDSAVPHTSTHGRPPHRVPSVPVVPVPGGGSGTVPALLRRPREGPMPPPPPPASTPIRPEPDPSPDTLDDEDDFIEMSPEDIPTCSRCNDLCDVQTLDDRWHCSSCDPDEAKQRRETTRRWLATAKRLRNQNKRG